MVMDHYFDEWGRRIIPGTVPVPFPTYPAPLQPMVTPEEIAEFRRLLERARKYDIEHNQPDCEIEEKRKKLKDLAKELNVEIDFV